MSGSGRAFASWETQQKPEEKGVQDEDVVLLVGCGGPVSLHLAITAYGLIHTTGLYVNFLRLETGVTRKIAVGFSRSLEP